jgi:cysteine desulfurase
MSVAFEQSQREQNKLVEMLVPLRDSFEELLMAEVPGLEVIGASARRSPHITNLVLPDLDGEVVVSRLREQVAISSGAACNGFSMSASHVLLEMGISQRRAARSIRISFGLQTNAEEIEDAVRLIVSACQS